MAVKLSTNKGIAIAEILIYLFFLAAFTLAIMKSFVIIASSYSTIRGSKSITSSAETLLNRFAYEVRSAGSLSGTFGVASGTLSLTDGSTTTSFSLESTSGRPIITVSGAASYLTSSDVTATKFTLYQLQASSTSSGVTLQMTLKNTANKNTPSENFEASAMIRNSQ
jgi:hypothetical protein